MKKLLDLITLRIFAVTKQRKMYFIAAVLAVILISIFSEQIVYLLDELPYVRKVIEITIFALSIYIATSAMRIVAVSRYRKKNELDSEDQDNFTIGASTLVGTITAIGTIIWIFSVFEIEFFTFITSIALFSVALATIFKETIQDFVQGLAILFTANHKVGDFIQVGSQPKGMIIDISLAKMKLKLEDGSVLHLSNHSVNTSSVINLSDTRFTRVKLTVAIPKQIMATDFQAGLLEQLQTIHQDNILPQRSTFLVTELSDVDYKVQCEIALSQYSFNFERTIKNDVQAYVAKLPKPKKKK